MNRRLSRALMQSDLWIALAAATAWHLARAPQAPPAPGSGAEIP